MSDLTPAPQTRLAEDPTSELRRLVATASALAPPHGTQERIWQRLANPYERLIDSTTEELALVDLLRQAALAEPSPRAREIIWQRLVEEAAARAGVSEPRRPFETDDLSAPLLAREARLEPPYARQSRLYRKLQPSRPTWSPFRLAAFGSALAACVVLLVPFLKTRPNSAPIVAAAMKSIPAGASFALQSGEASNRWQVEGVGDCVLSGTGAQVVVASSDEHGVRLHLDRGGISIHALKRSKEAPLIIEANGVETQVVGTILTVEAIPGGANVFVHEGMVKVSAPGREPAFVGADQAWPVALAKPPVWAAENMGTLAGVKLASRTVLPAPEPMVAPSSPVVKESKAKIEEPRVEKKTTVESAPAPTHTDEKVAAPALPAPTAIVPMIPPPATSAYPSMKPPTFGPTITPVVTEKAIVPAPAPVVDGPAPRAAPAGVHFDLEALAHAYDHQSSADINEAITRLQREGASKWQALAGAYRALSRVDDEDGSRNREAANVSLVNLLDENGAVDMALRLRRELAPNMNEDDRSQARLNILESLVELNRWDEAVSAANDCLHECSPVLRVFAVTLEPQLFLLVGQPVAANEASLRAERDPTGKQKTAFFFAQRAKALRSTGQHERAREACRVSLSLDSYGLGAADCRSQQ